MKDLLRVVELGNHVVMVQVQRDLDWATASVARARILAQMAGKAVLLHVPSGVIVDSSGLEMIGTLQTEALSRRIPFGLVCADLNLRRLFKITGLDDFIAIYHTISEGYANILVTLAAA